MRRFSSLTSTAARRARLPRSGVLCVRSCLEKRSTASCVLRPVSATQGASIGSRRRFSSSSDATSPLGAYQALLAAGELQQDPRQEVAMAKLEDLSKRLVGYAPSGRMSMAPQPSSAPASGGGGFFGGLFGGGSKAPPPKKEAPKPKLSGPRGLYLWGGTGTGKTFMMDLFYNAVPVDKKKRIHFHEWMIDVHERLHRLQKMKGSKDSSADDLVAQVAAEMMNEAWLLCFDEFQVTHISDAIILKRVFEVLWGRGCVVVATSNRPPGDLYLNGLNRSLFLPFIPMVQEFCEVHAIGADVDYRLISHHDGEDDRVYIYPNGPEERKGLERKFYRICQGEVHTGNQLETQGRRILVPKCAVSSNVAWFDFKDLCDKPLGAADYLAIAGAFHTIFIANIPKLTLQERDQVRRFITLVDSLYERHTKLVCAADRDPITLFEVSEKEKQDSTFDEIFAWDRTVSRLMEMQSTKYLSDQVQKLDSEQFLGQFKLVSLTDDDLKAFWRRYDVDDSGSLDKTELRTFLEDLLEKQKGHRNLSDEVFEACAETIDVNKDGQISFDEFESYLKDFSLVASTVRF